MNRRSFVKRGAMGTLLVGSGQFSLSALASQETSKLCILHTNDVHSRIEPFPTDSGRNSGKGGVSRRAALIETIRKEEEQVLLLDAGDIFQGTPYFNFFKGSLEMKLMSAMGYDAATLGNHDFDNGVQGLVDQLPHANFPLINCNYLVQDTPLHDKVMPHKIFQKGDLKIGVLGVGIDFNGLVPDELYAGVVYQDPIAHANKAAATLKAAGCNFVICLSHLGFKYRENRIDDHDLAKQSEHIDLIIGGHTHTFLSEPVVVGNQKGKAVVINQVGWAGIMLGRIDVYFEYGKPNRCSSCRNVWIV